jgi:hypothetical protein
MKKLPFLLLAALGLASCTVAQDAYLPDGSTGYHIACGGAWLSMADCTQKAGDICGPAGYKIYSQSGEYIPYTSSGGETVTSANRHGVSSASDYSSTSGSIVQRDMFVKCNKAP